MTSFLSFHLVDSFVDGYKTKEPPFGFRDAGGNSLGELVFIRTYSRQKEDGTKERWWETCRRVIEGMYSIQKDWAKEHVLPWNDRKAQASAQEAYDLLFNMKWMPPGRGLFAMGTYVVNGRKDSTPLQNCAFISTFDMTKNDPSLPFTFLMNVSMLGVGVGYDTRGAEKEFIIHEPNTEDLNKYVIPDSREGWVESLKLKLESYLIPGKHGIIFDYSLIRPRGAPIVTFGGIAPGPKPLMRLHKMLDRILGNRDGEVLSDVDIADIANLIGDCVVSGNVRRSALLAYGRKESKGFLNLKNYEVYPERNNYSDPENPGWAYMSNNSVRAFIGDDLSAVIPGIMHNGEPGIIWEDVTKAYGRLADPPNYKDHRFAGFNPCAEQPLESGEMCTLVDIHLSKVEDEPELIRALKYAYLYAKTVTLLPTHIPMTNAIMQRNRRIGIGLSGIANFSDNFGMTTLRKWMDDGYKKVKEYDVIYSEWLAIRESIKLTTVKPNGNTSLLVGESPGAHWAPGGEYFNRAMILDNTHPIVDAAREAGYTVERSLSSPDSSVVVYFPIHWPEAKRTEQDVSIFEKIGLAVEAQRWWSDNGVSITVSFKPEEREHVPTVISMHEGQLKAVSFMEKRNDVYPQQPYTDISSIEYVNQESNLNKIDFSILYDNGVVSDGEGEAYCTTDVCEIPGLIPEQVE